MNATITEAALALRTAHDTGKPCPPVRARLPKGDVDAAYAVQDENTRYWLAQKRRLVGRKIGLTAKAVQRQLGVDQPDFGMLFADMAMNDGEEIAAGRVLQPKVEAEIAFILERDVTCELPTSADMIRATAYVLPAIEIVGSRVAGWDIDIVDTVADNASSGLFVLGGPPRRIDEVDLRGCGMLMECRGQPISMGAGAACLGNPLNAAVWLARKMVAIGRPLRAGDVIMSGALGAMAPVQAGDTVEAHITGLGSVRIAFAA